MRAYFLWSLRDNFPNLLDHDPRLVGAARVLEQGCGRYLRSINKREGRTLDSGQLIDLWEKWIAKYPIISLEEPSGPARFVLRGAPRALGLVQLGRGEVPRVAAADAAGDEDAAVGEQG
jgi:hypothetical protein